MIFEVKKNGKVMYSTKDKELIPPAETLKSMRAAGYVPYLDGKILKIGREQQC